MEAMSAWSRCGRKPLPVLSTAQNKAGISLTQAGGRPRLHSEFVGYTAGLCLREMKERCTGGAGQWLRVALPEDPFPAFTWGSQLPVTPAPGELTLSSGPLGHPLTRHILIQTHTLKTFIPRA